MPRYRDVYELAEEVGGMYAVVVAAAKRARQLREGRHPVVDAHSSNPLTIAIDELLNGKVLVRPPGEVGDDPSAETEVVEVAAPERESADATDEEADEEATSEDDD